jgi:hypothetical protein
MVAPSMIGSSWLIATDVESWSSTTMSRSRHCCDAVSSVVPVPSGSRKIGAPSPPTADRTSISTVRVVELEPSETSKSTYQVPTSAASGVQRQIALPLGDRVRVARLCTSGMVDSKPKSSSSPSGSVATSVRLSCTPTCAICGSRASISGAPPPP